MGANMALQGAMASTSKTMGQMNRIMQPQKVAADMRAFQQSSTKMEMTEEISKFFFVDKFCLIFFLKLMIHWMMWWGLRTMKKNRTRLFPKFWTKLGLRLILRCRGFLRKVCRLGTKMRILRRGCRNCGQAIRVSF